MKNITALFMALFLVFTTNAGEYLLSSMSVEAYNASLEISTSAEVDLREAMHGSDIDGTYLSLNSGCHVLFNMTKNKQVNDSILVFLDVFRKWHDKITKAPAEFVKEIGSFESVCFFTDRLDRTDVGYAEVTFKFASTVSKESGKLEVYLLVFVSEVKGRIEEYVSCKPDLIFFTPSKARELQYNLKNIEILKKAAVEKQKASETFTR